MADVKLVSKEEKAKGESLVDVHRSLSPTAQRWLTEKDSKTHHELLENMHSMMPDERGDYMHSQMRSDEKAFEEGYKEAR